VKDFKKIGVGLGLVMAAALVAGCTEADAADVVAYEPAVVETVIEEPEVEEVVEAEPSIQGVEEIPLFALENAGPFYIDGELVFDQVDAQSQSLSDFAFVPFWLRAQPEGVQSFGTPFFLDASRLTPLSEDFGDLAPAGAFVLELDPADFSGNSGVNWDALNTYIREYEDVQNGIPTQWAFRDFPDMFYMGFTPLDLVVSGMQAVAIRNDDQSIDVQFSFENALELTEITVSADEPIIENGNYVGVRMGAIQILVNQGASTNQDTALRLSAAALDELLAESGLERLPNAIEFVDAQSGDSLFRVGVSSTLPRMIEIRLIPELVEAERQFMIQNNMSF